MCVFLAKWSNIKCSNRCPPPLSSSLLSSNRLLPSLSALVHQLESEVVVLATRNGTSLMLFGLWAERSCDLCVRHGTGMRKQTDHKAEPSTQTGFQWSVKGSSSRHGKKRRREKATQPMAGLICCVEVGWGGGVHSWLGSINPETSQIHIHRCMLLQTRKWTHANTCKHTPSLTSLAYQIAQIHTHICFFKKTKSTSVVSPLRSEKCFVIILDTRHFWSPKFLQ